MNEEYCPECGNHELECDCIRCPFCKGYFSKSNMYEYRGVEACEKCFDKAQKVADNARQREVAFNKQDTERYKGLDFGDSVVGKANREIFGLKR